MQQAISDDRLEFPEDKRSTQQVDSNPLPEAPSVIMVSVNWGPLIEAPSKIKGPVVPIPPPLKESTTEDVGLISSSPITGMVDRFSTKKNEETNDVQRSGKESQRQPEASQPRSTPQASTEEGATIQNTKVMSVSEVPTYIRMVDHNLRTQKP